MNNAAHCVSCTSGLQQQTIIKLQQPTSIVEQQQPLTTAINIL